MRSGLHHQMLRLYLSREHEYAAFRASVANALSDRTGDPLFPCVVRHLWMDDAGEPTLSSLATLRHRYSTRAKRLGAGIADAAKRFEIEEEVIADALRVWQPASPVRLTANDGVRMTRAVRSLPTEEYSTA